MRQGQALQTGAHNGGRPQFGEVRAAHMHGVTSSWCSTKGAHATHHLSSEARYGRLLAPYLDNPAHAFIVSSDFCHWGTRFNYTFYDSSQARRCLRLRARLARRAGHASQCGVLLAGRCSPVHRMA